MPGSPPISMTEPRTTPPPRTLSNSEIFVEKRSAAFDVILSIESGGSFVNAALNASGPWPIANSAPKSVSSTREFHVLHSGHLPSQPAAWYPHSWHTNTVFRSEEHTSE